MDMAGVFRSSRGTSFHQLWQYYPSMRCLYTEVENTYEVEHVLRWMKNHWEVPIVSVAAYLVIVLLGPSILKRLQVPPMPLRYSFAAWNALLSVFSLVGMVRTLPHLLYLLLNTPFANTVCAHPEHDWGAGATGLWVQLFVLSKIPELLDTVFLVLKQKKVIFLHWFHHVVTLLFCWHAYTSEVGTGLYFVVMNYSVHAVMYAYFGLQTLSLVPKWFPTILITVTQIAQMFAGMGVIAASAYYKSKGRTCAAPHDHLLFGGVVYGSFCVLFVAFFLARFNLFSSKAKKL